MHNMMCAHHRQQYERFITIAAYSRLLLQSVHFAGSEILFFTQARNLGSTVLFWTIHTMYACEYYSIAHMHQFHVTSNFHVCPDRKVPVRKVCGVHEALQICKVPSGQGWIAGTMVACSSSVCAIARSKPSQVPPLHMHVGKWPAARRPPRGRQV